MTLSFLHVYDFKAGYFRIALDDEPMIDAAVSQWVDSGQTKDTLLMLTALDGGFVKTLASRIGSWATSTPATRAADRATSELIEQEADSGREGWRDE